MIYIGFDAKEKSGLIHKISSGFRKTYIFTSGSHDLSLNINAEFVEYADVIEYPVFYRLLAEIDKDCLIVANEFIKAEKRRDLTYNCLAKYINQAGRTIAFQYTPFIYGPSDFMILADMVDTRHRLQPFQRDLWGIAEAKQRNFDLRKIDVPTIQPAKYKYQRERDKLLANIGEKDPHTIPRNLALLVGYFKVDHAPKNSLVRNMRFGCGTSYKDAKKGIQYTMLDFPLSRLDFCQFLYQTGQERIDALCTDLGVDTFYFNQYTEMLNDIRSFYGHANIYA